MSEPRGESRTRGNQPIDTDLPARLPSRGILVEETLSREVIGAFYRVYNRRGFGHLESVYTEMMARELRSAGIGVQKEALMDVWDLGERVGRFRADLLVEERIIVEVKSTEILAPTARRQLLNYLRCCDIELGLLLHFGPEPRFHRIIQSLNLGRTIPGQR